MDNKNKRTAKEVKALRWARWESEDSAMASALDAGKFEIDQKKE